MSYIGIPFNHLRQIGPSVFPILKKYLQVGDVRQISSWAGQKRAQGNGWTSNTLRRDCNFSCLAKASIRMFSAVLCALQTAVQIKPAGVCRREPSSDIGRLPFSLHQYSRPSISLIEFSSILNICCSAHMTLTHSMNQFLNFIQYRWLLLIERSVSQLVIDFLPNDDSYNIHLKSLNVSSRGETSGV